MTARYRSLLFSPDVRAVQTALGSSAGAGGEADTIADRLTDSEAAFIAARDSFYMATTGADGWPYLQHRGGAKGFVRVISDTTLALADYRGNRQYISLGNLVADNRASLFFMDYVNRARLKVLGRIHSAPPEQAQDVVDAIEDERLKVRVERVLFITVEAFDWNCPQYITPRFTADDLKPLLDRNAARIAALEQALASAGLTVPPAT